MVSNEWQIAFERRLDRVERPYITKVRRYYNKQSDMVINKALSQGRLDESDLLNVFMTDDMMNLYIDLYDTIGLSFANWYARNFDKYISKGVNPSGFQSEWSSYFKGVGFATGAERVTLVQGTAKKNLIRVTRSLMADEVFIASGEKVKARMMRKKFNRYNKYQAERLVRTESTNAANAATLKSAESIFPNQQMRKEWISAIDERTRQSHLAAHGQIVDFNNSFTVQGEQLRRPGDPRGSASNVVNCRCSVAPFPVENAQAIGRIDGISGLLSTVAVNGVVDSFVN